MASPKPPPSRRRYDAPPPEPPRDGLEGAAARLPELRLPTDPADRVRAARAFLEEGRALIRSLHDAGAAGRTVVRLHSLLMDRLLVAAWEATYGRGADACLAAVGGYGRSELSPFSDVDLLFLHAPGADDAVRRAAEDLLYLLWDTGLQVGHAVRTPADCLAVAEEDHTARTAMVDCRFLAGDRPLYDGFEEEMLGQVHSRRVEVYVRDKVEEWRTRHDRFGDTVFRLEPDVKNGEGGLRDLHTALWIARACYHVAGLSALGRNMLLPPREVSDVRAARDFLWRVRNALHYRAGRRQDLLAFDAQEDVSAAFGYADEAHELGVERFMRDYYLSARTVLRVSRHIIERCIESRGALPFESVAARPVAPGFKVWRGRLTVSDPALFHKDPAAVIRLFEIADREDVPLYSFTRDLVRGHVSGVDDAWRARPEVAAALRRLLTREGTRGAFLQAMHETGVLAALVPEFGRQTGLWQHDLYHTYTVDVHSLFAVRRLLKLRAGDLDEPTFAPAMQALENPYPLYLGAWFHDIGKGLGGGHSEKGAALVPAIARRLQLSAEEADEVAFLVRAHLRMSHISQRRDLSDPELVASFAEEVGSLRRLTLLLLLTFADVGTTGDGTWTDWKATLLLELYDKAKAVLEAAGGGRPAAQPALASRAREGAAALAGRLGEMRPEADLEAFLAAVPDRYLATIPVEKAAAHLDLLAAAGRKGTAVRRVQHRRKGYTEVMVASHDRPGLLSDLTGAFAAHGVDILAAEIFSFADGRILDVFLVRDRRGGVLADPARWRATKEDLVAAAATPGHGDRLVAARLRPSALHPRPAPPVPVQVQIDEEASADQTVVDVFARDRLGLLHTLTRTLHDLGLSVAVARIATEAHRATDAFYVTGEDGKKIEDPARLREIVRRLEACLAEADREG